MSDLRETAARLAAEHNVTSWREWTASESTGSQTIGRGIAMASIGTAGNIHYALGRYYVDINNRPHLTAYADGPRRVDCVPDIYARPRYGKRPLRVAQTSLALLTPEVTV